MGNFVLSFDDLFWIGNFDCNIPFDDIFLEVFDLLEFLPAYNE